MERPRDDLGEERVSTTGDVGGLRIDALAQGGEQARAVGAHEATPSPVMVPGKDDGGYATPERGDEPPAEPDEEGDGFPRRHGAGVEDVSGDEEGHLICHARLFLAMHRLDEKVE